MSSPTRAHIIIPSDILSKVDDLVGARERSKFFVEAVKEKLDRERRSKIFREAAGSLEQVDIPGWDTSESAVEWVKQSRQRGSDRLKKQWGSDE